MSNRSRSQLVVQECDESHILQMGYLDYFLKLYTDFMIGRSPKGHGPERQNQVLQNA